MADGENQRVKWIRTAPAAGPRLASRKRTEQSTVNIVLAPLVRAPFLRGILPEAAASPSAIELAREIFGTPAVPTAASAVGEAVTLLKTAAEIEHSLLVQYLYAGLAAKDVDLGDGTSPNSVIRTIAIEEMGHLMTVQNLRLALGSEPHFRRQDEFVEPDYDPYPYILEPPSSKSLAKYVAAEAPDSALLSDTERKKLSTIVKVAEIAAGVAVIHRVALIYMRLFYLFQEGEAAQAPWPAAAEAGTWGRKWHVQGADFSPTKRSRELLAADWSAADSAFLGREIVNTESARAAIHEVAAQGEGSEADSNSHYRRFLKLYLQTAVTGVPTRPVPVLGIDGVSAEPAATLVKLFDARYELLLINLQQLFLYDRSNPIKFQILEWCRDEMKLATTSLYRLIVKRPRRVGAQPDVEPAAPVFAMPSAVVPPDRGSLIARLRTALDISEQLMKSAIGAGAPAKDPAFARMAAVDAKRKAGLISL